MPKITKEEANKSENFWLWNQTNEDATADLNWSGEDLEQDNKKWIEDIYCKVLALETGPFQGHPVSNNDSLIDRSVVLIQYWSNLVTELTFFES